MEEKKFRDQFDRKPVRKLESGCDIYLKISEFYQPSPLDSLLVEHNEADDSDTHISDVRLLFHQRDIENQLGADNVRRLLAQMSTNVARGSSRVENMSDDALMKFIKDRNIQHLSEVRAYSQYLNEVAQGLEQQAQDLVAEYQATLNPAANQGASPDAPAPATE